MTAGVRTLSGVSGVWVVGMAAALVFSGHALVFGDWLIDDAGISFAYARNLALGHGLVSQPGVEPVEGFSNPAWTVLIASLMRLRLFDPAWTPKLVGLGLAAATFRLIALASARAEPLWSAALAPLWLSLSTSYVVWVMSGLENALLGLLLVASCSLTCRRCDAPWASRWDYAAGALAAAVALTRPDGILMSAAFPLSLALASLRRRRPLIELAAPVLRFGLSLVTLAGGYALFRHAYFGEWLPNTYFAKERPSLASLLDLAKLRDFVASLAGDWAPFLVLAWAIARLVRSRPPRVSHRGVSLLIHLALAVASYLVLPEDWMGEYRFATGAIVFACWTTAELVGSLWRQASGPGLRFALIASVVAITADSAARHAERSAAFATYPPAPFREVAAFGGAGYNAVAAALEARNPSLLVPDVGGTLFYSSLRVYDLVGLCDRVTARTLTHDTRAFHRYVLEDVRPTFIHVHGTWSGWAAFHSSPTFTRDYVPIFEARDPSATTPGGSNEPDQGDYVRRDALDSPARLAQVRRVFLRHGMARATF
jgi:hypothetical protein